ncbi:hypothetical protein CEXT_139791 [Caerostris extrusa]|uniref:Uncharacterized protein n=1 Tax=Caerostris extrusa TaxID=172846 RepID=A0AAV4X4U2_CAEEX|nr:hypothetical protein CEXT_139791 [Caerostris extrusa]
MLAIDTITMWYLKLHIRIGYIVFHEINAKKITQKKCFKTEMTCLVVCWAFKQGDTDSELDNRNRIERCRDIPSTGNIKSVGRNSSCIGLLENGVNSE